MYVLIYTNTPHAHTRTHTHIHQTHTHACHTHIHTPHTHALTPIHTRATHIHTHSTQNAKHTHTTHTIHTHTPHTHALSHTHTHTHPHSHPAILALALLCLLALGGVTWPLGRGPANTLCGGQTVNVCGFGDLAASAATWRRQPRPCAHKRCGCAAVKGHRHRPLVADQGAPSLPFQSARLSEGPRAAGVGPGPRERTFPSQILPPCSGSLWPRGAVGSVPGAHLSLPKLTCAHLSSPVPPQRQQHLPPAQWRCMPGRGQPLPDPSPRHKDAPVRAHPHPPGRSFLTPPAPQSCTNSGHRQHPCQPVPHCEVGHGENTSELPPGATGPGPRV